MTDDHHDNDHLQRERAFFDASSSAQWEGELPPPGEHVAMLRDLLGPPEGRRILDCGCGAGDLALELARDGGDITGFDLSPGSVRLMGARATRLGVNPPGGLVSVMEHLPFAEGAFDAVVGKSILHHVDVAASLKEVRRVLKPGGVAVFIENQVTNPLLRFARNKLTGRFGVARLGTIDEHPLEKADYIDARRTFPDLTLHYPDFRFLGLFSRNVLRYERAMWLARAFGRTDEWVYAHVERLHPYGYHVILRASRNVT